MFDWLWFKFAFRVVFVAVLALACRFDLYPKLLARVSSDASRYDVAGTGMLLGIFMGIVIMMFASVLVDIWDIVADRIWGVPDARA